MKISNVLQDIKPIQPQVGEIYNWALRGLVKSQIQYNWYVIEFVEAFRSFSRKDLSELINGEACSLMLLLIKDQTESLFLASKELVTLFIYLRFTICG